MLKNKVENTIEKYNLINKGDSIVIGVSGGPDSICLLHIMNEIKAQLGIEICVAHINHMIRQEADMETEYVQRFCNQIGVDCYVKKVNVLELAETNKTGTEETGRKVRYEFFEEVSKIVGANKIATAHNANDNAETVLMNIFRGCGISGLKGIEPIRDNKFIRPLIECERFEIEAYCEENKLEPKIDKSNFDNTYTRNKIRNIIIPEIKENFNPNIIASINKLSSVAKEENDFVEKYVDNIMSNELIISKNEKERCVELNLKAFNKLEGVIKSKVILNSIKIVMGNVQGIEKIHIDDIIKLCNNNIGNKFLTPNKKIKVSVNRGTVTFEKMNI